MSEKILVVDSVATNRIVLKVKMTSAQYDVRACGTCEEAAREIAADMPDLVLINLSDPVEDRHAFCRKLRNAPAASGLAIVAVGIADTARARFAALDAGADDVLPVPISDALLLARVRSLLRRHNLVNEWQMRDGLGRVFGLEEDRAPRIAPARITVLSDDSGFGVTLTAQLQKTLRQAVQLLPGGKALLAGSAQAMPDLFVIDGTGAGRKPEPLFRMIADLRSRQSNSGSALMVVAPQGRPDLAAMALDLGADDVVFPDCGNPELGLRVRTLIAEKRRQDARRDRVRDGLQAAITDPLTGLHNRRYCQMQLRQIADQAHAARCEYAVLMLDIDHFKAINDQHGHAAGDAVLRQIADRLRTSFRAIDLVARIGGEEFLVAMPNTPAVAAQLAAERLRKVINSRPFDLGEGQPALRVTISVGIAVDNLTEAEVPSLETMFDRADRALYAAKGAGRNRVSLNATAA